MKKLSRSFFMRPTVRVARELLGKTIARKIGSRVIRARITETEAYVGPHDKANHASRGRTPRTEIMFGDAGHAYVYLIYGMHWCFNIVTERTGTPSAVLIRGVEIDGKHINGPGRVSRVLQMNKKLNGADLIGNRMLWLEKGGVHRKHEIHRGTRIGVDYAGAWAKKPWRFWI